MAQLSGTTMATGTSLRLRFVPHLNIMWEALAPYPATSPIDSEQTSGKQLSILWTSSSPLKFPFSQLGHFHVHALGGQAPGHSTTRLDQAAWIQAPPGNPQPHLAHGPGEQRGCISQVVSAGGQGLSPAVLQRYQAQTHPIPAILMSRDSSMKRAGNRMLVSCFLGADPFHVSPVIGYFKVILFQHLHLNKMSLE